MEGVVHRIEKGKWISGVCTGFAAHYHLSVWLVRLLWVGVCCFFGSGLLAYILAAICLPKQKEK